MTSDIRNDSTRIKEYARFIVTGVLNTAVDFAVLNSLILMLGHDVEGTLYTGFKTISFFAALVNSYFMNKYWVFGHAAAIKKSGLEEGGKFFAVSFAGFIINVSSSLLIFSALTRANILDPHLAANAGAIIGTGLVLVWNYVGYKFFVFKPQKKYE